MQAIILAAGLGKRIPKYSALRPKAMLKINGKSIIQHQIELFNKHGIKDIAVVVGYKHNLLRKALKLWKISYVFNPFYESTNNLGSFWFALNHQHADFILANGDTVFEEEILARLLKTPGHVVLPIDRKKCGEEEMKVKLKKGNVVEINKTMPPSSAYGEFIGIAKFNGKGVSGIKSVAHQIMENKEFNTFYELAIQKFIDQNLAKVKAVDITGLKWNEIDFEEDYIRAKKLFKNP